MELTPEEKRRIYEEEKTRLEAQERLKGERRDGGFQNGCIGCIVIVVALLLLSMLMASMKKDTPTSRRGSTPSAVDSGKVGAPPAGVDSGKIDRLRGKVLELGLLGVIERIDFPKVYVGPGFYELSFHKKVAAIKTVNDFIAYPSGGVYLDVCDGRSGRKIYDWKPWGRLEPK